MAQAATEFMTAAQLVTRWNGVVTNGTLANWRVNGKGPAFVKIGGRVLYPTDKVVEWEKQNMRAANDNKPSEE